MSTNLMAQRKLRPPLKRHGGKAYLARRIIALMPEHDYYCEPFVGGGSVFLNKTRAAVEVIADADPDLVNFWRVLRDDPLFVDRCRVTAYDVGFFDKALGHSGSPSDLVRAWCYIVRNRFSRGGLGKAFAWSDRLRRGMPGDVSAWETAVEELPRIAERTRLASIPCMPAIATIEQAGGNSSLFYLDPPYLPSTRTTRKAYAHEMTRDDHANLLDLLGTIRGKFLLSGYPSPLYDDAARKHGWGRVEFSMPNHSGQGKVKQRRTEVVWMNYEPEGLAS